jgi:hypothetical protein
MTHSAEEPPV